MNILKVSNRFQSRVQSAVRQRQFSTSSTISSTSFLVKSNVLPNRRFMTPMSIKSFSTKSSNVETREFRAETKQLLDIVTNSIYTDKEVFIRELVSNASDALEKLRYKQTNGEVHVSGSAPLGISVTIDKSKKTLTIADNGVGMTREELIDNLGIIARSGSRNFVKSLDKGEKAADPHGIIGQFGVGFYSSFMVADRVTVESIHAPSSAGTEMEAHRWSSDGSGEFTVEKIERIAGTDAATDAAAAGEDFFAREHGTKIVMHLKEKFIGEFTDEGVVKSIIKKYSNFVAFPITLNGETVNTVSAIWNKSNKEVTTEQYTEFYKFISNAYDTPRYVQHYRTDAPLDLKVLFFVPQYHTEKFGGGHMERGVNLYSRKVLIESKPADLLPNWLRFIRGVVDSEDLPLSLSREKPQDSNLLRRIREVVTRKLVRFFEDQMKDNMEKYKEFHNEYSYFLKEGVCSDAKFAESIAKLLMFESSTISKTPSSGVNVSELTTLDEYISRCSPEHKDIYYLVSTSRSAALASPYMELFVKHNIEVILLYSTIDDFVMGNLKTYQGRKLLSIEQSEIDISAITNNKPEAKDGEAKSEAEKEAAKSKESAASAAALGDQQVAELCGWLKLSLGEGRVREVKSTARLSDSPAIVTDHESGSLRKMMKMVEHANQGSLPPLPPQVLEINPKHPIIIGLFAAVQASRNVSSASESASTADIPEAEIVGTNSSVSSERSAEITKMSKMVAEQIFDNALIAAGLADDPRSMLPRLNKILLASLNK